MRKENSYARPVCHHQKEENIQVIAVATLIALLFCLGTIFFSSSLHMMMSDSLSCIDWSVCNKKREQKKIPSNSLTMNIIDHSTSNQLAIVDSHSPQDKRLYDDRFWNLFKRDKLHRPTHCCGDLQFFYSKMCACETSFVFSFSFFCCVWTDDDFCTLILCVYIVCMWADKFQLTPA